MSFGDPKDKDDAEVVGRGLVCWASDGLVDTSDSTEEGPVTNGWSKVGPERLRDVLVCSWKGFRSGEGGWSGTWGMSLILCKRERFWFCPMVENLNPVRAEGWGKEFELDTVGFEYLDCIEFAVFWTEKKLRSTQSVTLFYIIKRRGGRPRKFLSRGLG